MRKAVALLGLVLIPMGFGGSALAREGRDSSGQFGYALECVTGGGVSEPLFINQSLNSGAITVQDGAGNTQFDLQGFDNSGRYDWDGGWQVIYDDGGGFQILDAGTETPAEVCGGTTPTTTAPSTTGPSGSVIRNIGVARGSGFVAAGAEIGPGSATFGVTGFAAGEQITVTLHSTPRALGTVTADARGVASITFEVLASDGAGEHGVEFSGPSGTFSVPFTLVLPAQSLPVTR